MHIWILSTFDWRIVLFQSLHARIGSMWNRVGSLALFLDTERRVIQVIFWLPQIALKCFALVLIS